MVSIDELPDNLRCFESINLRDIPQLTYVVEMSQKLCPNAGFIDYGRFFLLGGPCIFLKRYFEGYIDTSFKSAYQTNDNLQDTLSVYNIDPTAFWYLILFLKDFVDDESTGEKCVPNAYSDLYSLTSRLNEMGFCENPLDGEYIGCKNGGSLKLKVGKHWLEINNDKALYGLFCAMCSYLRKVQPKKRKELINGVWEEVNIWDNEIENMHLFCNSVKQEKEIITIPETYRISYYATYMRIFLKSFSTTNTNWRISNDKWLLISRVIYIIGYSSDVRYNTRRKPGNVENLDFLKGNYKKDRYKDTIIRKIYV